MTPAPEWYAADADDADRYPTTPHTGHLGADLSDADGRNPLEPTNVYIRRLVTERNEARAEAARLMRRGEGQCTSRLDGFSRPSICNLRHGHAGMHEDGEGAVWGVTEPFPFKPPCFCGGEHHA